METQDLDALVIAGGESRRMGGPKALLPMGDTTILGTILSLLQPMFRNVIVVARETKSFAWLGSEVLADDRPERGPLVGLARGLAASDAPWCFVVGCDMPLLQAGVIGRMCENLDGCDILVPYLDGRLQSLHAFYSRKCLSVAENLLDNGTTSLRDLFPLCKVRTMVTGDFLDIDPEMLSFKDIDTKDDYVAALKLADRRS